MSGSVEDVYDITILNSGSLAVAATSASIAAVSASLAYERADVAAISASIAASASLEIQNQIFRLEKAEFGRWQIFNNQMIFYEPDGITEIAKFNLFDADGNPTSTNVFDRRPV